MISLHLSRSWLPQNPGYRRSDLFSMKSTVLDEDLVGMHSGDDDSRQIHTRPGAFKSLGIGARAECLRFQLDPVRGEKLEVRPVTGHSEHEVILELNLSLGSIQKNRDLLNPDDSRIEVTGNHGIFDSMF